MSIYLRLAVAKAEKQQSAALATARVVGATCEWKHHDHQEQNQQRSAPGAVLLLLSDIILTAGAGPGTTTGTVCTLHQLHMCSVHVHIAMHTVAKQQ